MQAAVNAGSQLGTPQLQRLSEQDFWQLARQDLIKTGQPARPGRHCSSSVANSSGCSVSFETMSQADWEDAGLDF